LSLSIIVKKGSVHLDFLVYKHIDTLFGYRKTAKKQCKISSMHAGGDNMRNPDSRGGFSSGAVRRRLDGVKKTPLPCEGTGFCNTGTAGIITASSGISVVLLRSALCFFDQRCASSISVVLLRSALCFFDQRCASSISVVLLRSALCFFDQRCASSISVVLLRSALCFFDEFFEFLFQFLYFLAIAGPVTFTLGAQGIVVSAHRAA
jgi:hypothetical protein